MGSGGGATSSADMVPYQKNVHGLLMQGKESGGTDWEGNAEAGNVGIANNFIDNPSVLRFLIENGLTDAGGNPFEGVSTYDPAEDVESISDRANIAKKAVDSFSTQADWQSGLNAAMTARSTVVETLDLEALVSEVVSNSLTRSSSMLARALADASSVMSDIADVVHSDAVSRHREVVDDDSSQARVDVESLLDLDKIDTESRVDDAVVSHKEAVADVVGEAASASGSMKAAADEYSGSQISRAASRASDDAASAIDASATKSEDDATSAMEAAAGAALAAANELLGEGDAQSGLMATVSSDASEQTASSVTGVAGDMEDLAESIIDSIDTKVLADNALAETAMDNVFTEASADGATVAALLPTDADTFVGAAAASADENAKATMKLVTDNAIDTAPSKADGIVEAAMERADVSAKETLDASHPMSDTHAGSTMDAAISKGSGLAAEELASARNTADIATSDVMDRAVMASDSKASSLEATSRAIGKSAMTDVIGGITPDVSNGMANAVAQAKTEAAAVMSAAMQAAVDAADDTLVSSATTAYRKRALRPHLQGVNRFAGGMVDINAVNSSAFIIGMALLESDFTQNVSDFQTQLELSLYNTAIPQFLQSYGNNLTAYMQSYEQRFAQHLEVYNTSNNQYSKVFMSMLPEYPKLYMQGVADHVNLIQLAITRYTELSASNEGNHAAIVDRIMSAFSALATTTISAEIDSYRGTFSDCIRTASTFAEIDANMIRGLNELRSRMASDLSRVQVDAFSNMMSSSSSMIQGMFDAQLSASGGGKQEKGDLVTRLVEVYLRTLQSDFSERGATARSLVGDQIAFFDKCSDSEMQTLLALLSGRSDMMGTFAGMKHDRVGAFMAALSTRVGTYKDIADRESIEFQKSLGASVQTFLQNSSIEVDTAFRSRLTEAAAKTNFASIGAADMLRAELSRVDNVLRSATVQLDASRASIVANVEEYGRNLELDVLGAHWDMEMFQAAGNVLSSVTGSIVQKAAKPSQAQSTLAGFASGAGAGGAIGTAIAPGVGTAIGAGVGGIAGAIAGYQP